MVSEFMCHFHGKMVDRETGKPCTVILKYSKNYDGYWTGEDVVIMIQDTHKTFIKIQPGFLPMYILYNLASHHNKSNYFLHSREINLKNGRRNAPLLRDGYYKISDSTKVVHMMQTETVVKKGICEILTEQVL